MSVFKTSFRTLALLTPYAVLATIGWGKTARFYLKYVSAWLVVDSAGLAALSWSDSHRSTLCILAATLAVVRLSDMMLGFLKPLFAGPYPYIEQLDRIILLLVNIFETTICFATLFLFWGHLWDPCISDWLTAYYQSILTLTTLGYGEIKPLAGLAGDVARCLVFVQLWYTLVFLLLGFAIMTSEDGGGFYEAHEDQRLR